MVSPLKWVNFLGQNADLKGGLQCMNHCFVIFIGFYEWKAADSKKGGPKQPYLVYAAQDEGRPDVLAMSECTAENSYSEQNGWVGPKPLFLAGIFSIWHKPEVRLGISSTHRLINSSQDMFVSLTHI